MHRLSESPKSLLNHVTAVWVHTHRRTHTHTHICSCCWNPTHTLAYILVVIMYDWCNRSLTHCRSRTPLHSELVCVFRHSDRCESVLSGDLGCVCFWQILVNWYSACCCAQFVKIIFFFLSVCVSALIVCQRGPAVRADPLCHGDRYQGDDKGEGVSCAPDPRITTAAEEETSRGGFWTQEKVGVCCCTEGVYFEF